MNEYTVMRLMAWERAKGELQSMLQTITDGDQYDILNRAISDFIKDVEDNGKQE